MALRLDGLCELAPPAVAHFGRQRAGIVRGFEQIKMGRRFTRYVRVEWTDVEPHEHDLLRDVHVQAREPAPARSRATPAWTRSHRNTAALEQLRLQLGGG